jgi:hypothetical protein
MPLLKTLDTGPITNHVNIVRNANGMFAYVTIGGLNEIMFRTDNFAQVATIPVGKLPHAPSWCCPVALAAPPSQVPRKLRAIYADKKYES